MKVGLVNVDSKNIPPLTLKKIAAFHKANGDSVKEYDPLYDKPDVIFACKVFDFTPDYQYFPYEPNLPVIKGGTGYSLDIKLPPKIETIQPDNEIFPCDYTIGFASRGCIRNCKFCVVPHKEGKPRAVADIYNIWHGGGTELMLLDNNLTCLPDHFELVCKQLINEKIRVNFSQGLDIRLITSDMARLLSMVRLAKQLHFAFDNIKTEQAVRRGIKVLVQNGVSHRKLMFYVLIGFDSTPEEDLYRVELLRSLKVDPFVMPYNKRDPYQRRFARWVNHKAIFKTVSWQDYKG
ncbi:hypothetical protein [Phosphitispora fastidiosa]|uniref:hypothetical protein n=1 Tax=Phosphitispora fastidiosa TaxID=2837202 RepID=UPI001E5BDF9E|nr:hypothetical protein [Phosphitispora fastidiosa]MBU7006327.1 hypothetical protein [Phosphitispora fastidiosa]